MELLLFLGLVVLFTIVPIMISAKLLNAKHSSFLVCFIAAIASVASEKMASLLVANEWLAGLIAILITAMCFTVILGAKYVQSVLIALLTYGVQIFLAIVLATAGIVGSSI